MRTSEYPSSECRKAQTLPSGQLETVDQPAQHCCHALPAPLQGFLRDTWVAGLNKRKINMTNCSIAARERWK